MLLVHAGSSIEKNFLACNENFTYARLVGDFASFSGMNTALGGILNLGGT